MNPKTTLNLLKDFFSNNIQKTILFLLSFFDKKVWSNSFKISDILSLVFNSSINSTKTIFHTTIPQTAELKNIKSAPPEENYYYTLKISNFCV